MNIHLSCYFTFVTLLYIMLSYFLLCISYIFMYFLFYSLLYIIINASSFKNISAI